MESIAHPHSLTSCVGSFCFGLGARWGRREYDGSTGPHLSMHIPSELEKRIISTVHSSINVRFSRNVNDCKLEPYYGVKIKRNGGSGDSEMVISYENAVRLHYRYTLYMKELNITLNDSLVTGCDEVSDSAHGGCGIELSSDSGTGAVHISGEVMPGQRDTGFLNALSSNLERKKECSLTPFVIVMPDIYSLWSCTSNITTELFSDAIRESGVLKNFCSSAHEDVVFGSRGTWEVVEGYVEGAGGQPNLDPALLEKVLRAFEAGVRRESPYCRCAVLPLGENYPVQDYLRSLSFEGILLMTIGKGSLAFKDYTKGDSASTAQQVQFDLSVTHDTAFGLFVWRNRQYLLKHAPPSDVEACYMRWSSTYLHHPFKAVFHYDAFKKAFPLDLRCQLALSHLFPV